jgi:hypothetical protein
MGTFNETMSDLGEGTKNMLVPIVPALILLAVGLGIGYAVVRLIEGASVRKFAGGK